MEKMENALSTPTPMAVSQPTPSHHQLPPSSGKENQVMYQFVTIIAKPLTPSLPSSSQRLSCWRESWQTSTVSGWQ